MTSYLEQRESALSAANRIRLERAALKEELRCLSMDEGRKYVAALITHPPDFLWTMEVGRLLGFISRFGGSRVLYVLNAADVSFSARLGGRYGDALLKGGVPLTDRQRHVLRYRLLGGGV